MGRGGSLGPLPACCPGSSCQRLTRSGSIKQIPKKKPAPRPGERKITVTTNTQDPADSGPIIVGERPLKRGEIIRVHLEMYRGKWAVHVRKWYTDDHGELCPGKGFSCAPEYLPWLGVAIDDALKAAREKGLIAEHEEDAP
jgi:hypothetical protein